MDKPWELPLALQITLGGGYLAYLVAYAGLRERHTATDAIFRTIAFGLVASAILTWFDPKHYWVPIAAVIATVSTGAFWRWRGMDWSRAALRRSDISWTDDIPTAWLTVTATRTTEKLAQIAVDIEGGRTLMCDDTRRFADAPFGPCVFGLGGDVAMYVTAELRSDGTWLEHGEDLHTIQGANLTYLPASAIKRVELRYWTAAIEKAVAARVAAIEEPVESAAIGAAPNPEGMSDVQPPS
jgi:hypothetical protein